MTVPGCPDCEAGRGWEVGPLQPPIDFFLDAVDDQRKARQLDADPIGRADAELHAAIHHLDVALRDHGEGEAQRAWTRRSVAEAIRRLERLRRERLNL